MALRIASRFSSLTPPSPRVTMDTNDFETPALRATSRIVGMACGPVSACVSSWCHLTSADPSYMFLFGTFQNIALGTRDCNLERSKRTPMQPQQENLQLLPAVQIGVLTIS